METLPAELLIKIHEYLEDPQMIIYMSLTCKSINKIIKESCLYRNYIIDKLFIKHPYTTIKFCYKNHDTLTLKKTAEKIITWYDINSVHSVKFFNNIPLQDCDYKECIKIDVSFNQHHVEDYTKSKIRKLFMKYYNVSDCVVD
jgi:hypothetical protein